MFKIKHIIAPFPSFPHNLAYSLAEVIFVKSIQENILIFFLKKEDHVHWQLKVYLFN